jgi:hypothetical protein
MKTALLLPLLLIVTGAAQAARLPAIIDAHVHTSFDGERNEDAGTTYSKAGLLEEFERAGVVGAVSMMARTGAGYDDELARKHSMTFCYGISASTDFAAVEKGLKDKRFGCLKIYLGYVPMYPTDPYYERVYQLAEKYNVPVVFHTGDVWDKDGFMEFAKPLPIDTVAVKHRKVTFVIAHVGNPFIEEAAEVAYKNYNVYLDGSAVLVGDLSRYSKAYIDRQMIQRLQFVFEFVDNSKKLMFGSDWPLVSIDDYLTYFVLAIPAQDWPAVLHDNAVRVFKMNIPLIEPDTTQQSK